MKNKSWLAPAVGVIALIFFWILPPVAPLTRIGMRATGIFIFTIIWWATVSIGYPSLITLVLFIMAGVMSATDVIASSWGHWVPLWMMASMGLTECLRTTGFTRRFALWFVTRPFIAGRPWMLVGMFLLAVTALGSVLAGAATCIVFLAVAEPMFAALGYTKGDKFAATLVMGIAWASSAALSTTPISHVMAIRILDTIQRDFGISINYVQWMFFGIPLGLVFVGLLLLYFRFVVRPDVSRISGMATKYLRQEMAKLGPMKLEEKFALAVFVMVVILWMAPGIITPVLPGVGSYIGQLGSAVPPLVGVTMLILIRIKDKPLLEFKHWMTHGIDWATICLIATIQTMGRVFGLPTTGIAEFLTGHITPIASSVPLVIFVMIAMFWVVIQTNMMSNIVSQTLVYTIMVPIAASLGLGSPVALGVLISFASNYAFSLPSATTATAVVAGSGWVPVGFMAKYGILTIIPLVMLLTFVGYPFITAVLR